MAIDRSNPIFLTPPQGSGGHNPELMLSAVLHLMSQYTAGGDAADWETTFLNCPVLPTSLAEAMDGNKWTLSLACRGGSTGDLVMAQRA